MQELPRGAEVLPGLKPTEPPHFHDPPPKGEAEGEGGQALPREPKFHLFGNRLNLTT